MIRTIDELEAARRSAKALVSRQAWLSAGAAAVPIPGVDIVADLSMMTTLLPKISEMFELTEAQVEAMEPRIAQQALVFAASLGNTMIGRAITRRVVRTLLKRVAARVAAASVLKYVPFAGTAAAAGLSFGAMKLLGDQHIEDCYKTARRLIEVQAVDPMPAGAVTA